MVEALAHLFSFISPLGVVLMESLTSEEEIEAMVLTTLQHAIEKSQQKLDCVLPRAGYLTKLSWLLGDLEHVDSEDVVGLQTNTAAFRVNLALDPDDGCVEVIDIRLQLSSFEGGWHGVGGH
ncbi:hypothetical protein IW262DRAFT_1481665 [Armillaria fumosa]|nr:hypothetical protein IW262DRAFT_1481665 [Armillaria fumosa]